MLKILTLNMMAASLIIFSPHGVATPEGRKDEKSQPLWSKKRWLLRFITVTWHW